MFAELRSRGTPALVALIAFGLLVGSFTAPVRGAIAAPVAALCAIVCALAVARVFVVFPEGAVSVDARPAVAFVGAACVGLQVALALAVSGRLGQAGAGALVTLASLVVVVSLFRARDVAFGRRRGAFARDPLFFGTVVHVLVLVPMLGAFSLVDPWETHYGEVAREMVARRDPLSPFWANEGFFRTKPVMEMWLQAAFFRATEVDCASGNMLRGSASAVAAPEWATRAPNAALAIVGGVMLAAGVARAYGRRAGFFAQVTLATTAHYALLGHQSTTDMPLVASISASFGALSAAITSASPPASAPRNVRLFGVVLPVTASTALVVLFVALLVPELALLVSRNVGFEPGLALVHADRVVSGSAGNEGLVGQLPHVVTRVAYPRAAPVLQAVAWAGFACVVLAWLRELERPREAWVGLAFVSASVGTLAKGPAGFVFLALAVLVLAVVQRRSAPALVRATFVGGMALAVLVLPWFCAMHLRHGRAFTDELVMRHMIGRTLEHLHDTNQGEDTSARYYLWQLGYGLFPWVGMAPLALSGAGRLVRSGHREAVRLVLLVWAFAAFTLVTVMKTKFHHYVFPAVPPVAALVGIELSRLGRGPAERSSPRTWLVVLGAAITVGVGLDLVAGSPGAPGRGQARLLHLFTYLYTRSWPDTLDFRTPMALFAALAALSTLAVAWEKVRRVGAVALLGTSLALSVFVLDVYLVRTAPHWGQRGLFVRANAESPERDEPVVAFQMNWKGENFYAGNRLAIVLNDSARLAPYLEARRKVGRTELLAVCEHGRVSELRAVLGVAPWDIVPLTTPAENDKFVLVRLRAR